MKAIIKRLGFKEDSGHFQAKALVALAGEENVTITLRGPWRARQANVRLETPRVAKLAWDGEGFGIGPGGETSVTPDRGATVDIVARVERTIKTD